MTAPEVTVIVATRNRATQVTACVACLLAQDIDASRRQIIVVDDGSTDDTAARLGELERGGDLVVIRLAAAHGRSEARNAALRRAEGDVVVFIDSDAYAPSWWLRSHLEAHARHPGCIVDGPAILVRAFSAGAFSSLRVRALAALDIGGEQFVTVNTSCPRRALLDAGGFDPAFGLRYGWEDIELGVRLRKRGVGRVKDRRAFVLHERGADRLEEAAARQEECGVNAAVYYARHPTPDTARQIRVGVLRTAAMWNRLGVTSQRLQSVLGRRSPARAMIRPIATGLYLRHRYAQGLEQSLTASQLRELSRSL